MCACVSRWDFVDAASFTAELREGAGGVENGEESAEEMNGLLLGLRRNVFVVAGW